MRETEVYERYPYWPAIKRLLGTALVCGVAIWFCTVVVSCAELYAKQKADWLSACQADGNKPYQCMERWEHMQRGGE